MLQYHITFYEKDNTMIKSTTIDKFAISLSGVCMLHCLLAPVLITLAPILTLSAAVEDVLFHQLMLWIVLPTSVIALFLGCRQHQLVSIAATGFLGMLILVVVAFFGHDLFGLYAEKFATSLGGLILAGSHYLNYRACQTVTCEDKNCSTAHHH